MLVPALALALSLSAAADPSAADVRRGRVYVGVYLSDVSNLDLRAGRFDADLVVWAKWAGAAEAPRLEFLNGQLERFEELSRESDGDWHSVRWRAQGAFRGTFPLQPFPFDTQKLPIDLGLQNDARALAPDLAGSGMASSFSITGWLYAPYFRAERQGRKLASDLGSVRREGQATQVDSVAFLVDLRRPLAAYVVKFMVPLAIIVAMALLAAFVPHTRFEVRASLGVTALLSCVAFHFTQAQSLPDVPYLVAADKLFIGAYAVVFASIAQSLWGYRIFERDPVPAERLDRFTRWAGPLGTVSAAAVLLWVSFPASEGAQPPPRPASASAGGTRELAQQPLRVGVMSLGHLNMHGFGELLRRGLVHRDGQGELRPHLATVVPEMTNVEAVFRRNPYFSGKAPFFERIVFRAFPSSVELAQALEAGEIDLAPLVSVQGQALLRDAEGIIATATPSDLFHFLQPDLSVKPFDDLRVRQALAHAVDRTAVSRAILGGGGTIAHTYRLPSLPDFAAGARTYPHDPARARALLAEAGVTTPLPVTLLSPHAAPGTPHERAVQQVAADLREVGLDVKVDLRKSSLQQASNKGDHGGLLFYMRREGGRPDRFWNLPGARALFAGEASAAWQQYQATLFAERREVLSRRMQERWAEALPLIPVLFGADQPARRTELEGFNRGEADSIWWNVEDWHWASPKDASAAEPSTVAGDVPEAN
jgi:hypothetical protein